MEQKTRDLPGPMAIVFSTLALISAFTAALLSLFPFYGIFSLFPLIAGSIFTGIALVLCHFENSRRVLPFIAVTLLLLAAIQLIFQLIQWGEAFKILSTGL